MNYSSAGVLYVHTTVNLIMTAKPFNTIVGQSMTKSMDRMTKQMAQTVAPFKTTAWGGLHASLALVLNGVNYATITHQAVTLTNHWRSIQPSTTTLPSTNSSASRRKQRIFRRLFQTSRGRHQHRCPTHHQQLWGALHQGAQWELLWLHQPDNKVSPNTPSHQLV